MIKKLGKFLSNLGLVFGLVGILLAFVEKDIDIPTRIFYVVVGVIICLIAKVKTFRHALVSILFLLVSISYIFSLIDGDMQLNAASVLAFLCTLSICIYFGYKVLKHRNISQIDLHAIDAMNGLEFEDYTGKLLRKLGFTDVSVTKASGDQGIDVLATKNGLRYAIQCKNYQHSLDNTSVQEAYAGMKFYGCDRAAVITNSTFTSGAKELANAIGVELWDRQVLNSMISSSSGFTHKATVYAESNTTAPPRNKSELIDSSPVPSRYDYIEPISFVDQYIESAPAMDENDEFAKYGGIEAELLTIDLMSDAEFKSWCAQMMTERGYSVSGFPPYGQKEGVSFIAEYDGNRFAVFCNHSRSDLGPSSVQKVSTGKRFYSCHAGLVITNQYYKSSAKDLALQTGTLLWDRNSITEHLKGLKENVSTPENALHAATYSGPVDPMLFDAVELAIKSGQVSVSMLQRVLKLGYARAARVIDEMEALGIVGPFSGSTPRKVLVSREEWEQMREFIGNSLPF